MAKLLVAYFSAYGHIFRMAEAAGKGASDEGHEARLVRIPEFRSPDNITALLDHPSRRRHRDEEGLSGTFRVGARWEKYEAALAKQKHVPEATADDLRWADGIVWGYPTYFGSMPAQVKSFLDMSGGLCASGELEGKPTGVMTSAGSIHTGHEATILTSIVPLLHFGLIYVGLPYSQNPEYLTGDAIGGSPYGPSTLAGPDSSRSPDERELVMAGRLGARVARFAEATKGIK
ncbi:NAD(P)H-dependent oxidoreductase [Cohnella thailandensis]|uniref:NAD(P)H-dependent oxidoreductase n=1 Tax=Cohnella thailandensis TaxID=557557 RepID=A0A841T142_9BACL|nr:NAD(P)H-dependent oxidoreductase [Cohnella thailandensis]MBB6635800.1 NAD(P)H-dependent oxidoreductase [Cohnella thailandensis]MBP1976178.1 NAD(P)H dehydrogenase (quinone) [Cohnella thailandensis]